MDTGSIKRKGKMPLFWNFMAAEKTENWMLHRKVSTTMNFIVPAGYTPDIDLKETHQGREGFLPEGTYKTVKSDPSFRSVICNAGIRIK